MPELLDNEAVLSVATRAVAAADPMMGRFVALAGHCRIHEGEVDNFTALVRSIVFQQLAGAAATTIFSRLVTSVGGEVTPAALGRVDDSSLRGVGLSSAKLISIRDLAARVETGDVPLHDVADMTDAEITARLVGVRGIGPWTAQMFLLFQLRRADVWPTGDLGVRAGHRLIYGLPEMFSAKAMGPAGERFQPYRSVAAWYCWEAVHIARGTPTAV
ncbi:MAG: DNA-3-methyladenine glycosylase family protein [Candidatus Dormibacteria bacterium]